MSCPRTCKVETIIGLWYVLKASRRTDTNGSNFALRSSVISSLVKDSFYSTEGAFTIMLVYLSARFMHYKPKEPRTRPHIS